MWRDARRRWGIHDTANRHSFACAAGRADLCWSRRDIDEAALNASTLWWGLLFGSIGLGFFVYGRKQRAIVPLVCGIALMAFPYFVSGTAWLLVIGVALMAIPYFVRV
jgi:hypothetical protein